MVDKDRRTVVEVRDDLHRELRKLALLNDLRIYVLVNAIIEEALRDGDIRIYRQRSGSSCTGQFLKSVFGR